LYQSTVLQYWLAFVAVVAVEIRDSNVRTTSGDFVRNLLFEARNNGYGKNHYRQAKGNPYGGDPYRWGRQAFVLASGSESARYVEFEVHKCMLVTV